MAIFAFAYTAAIIIFLATGEIQIKTIKAEVKKKIKENFVEIWQIMGETNNFFALAFHAAHKQLECIKRNNFIFASFIVLFIILFYFNE